MSEGNNNPMNIIRTDGSNVPETNDNNLTQMNFHENPNDASALHLVNELSPSNIMNTNNEGNINNHLNHINTENRNSLGTGFNFSNRNRDNTINIQHDGFNEFFLMTVFGNNTINFNTINSSNNTNIRINYQNCNNSKNLH